MKLQEELVMRLGWEDIVKLTYLIIEKQRKEAEGERILNEILGRKKKC